MGITVADSSTAIEPSTKSPYNIHHVNVVTALLCRMYGAGDFAKARDMCIVTPYRAQVRCYTNALMDMTLERRIPRDRLPIVETITATLSLQFNEVILDLPYDKADTLSDLGLCRDERLCNAAYTRSRRSLLVIFNDNLTKGKLVRHWKPKKGINGRPELVPNPKPFIIAHIDMLRDLRCVSTIDRNSAALQGGFLA